MRQSVRHSLEDGWVRWGGVGLRVTVAFLLLIGGSPAISSAQELGGALLSRTAEPLTEPREATQGAAPQTAVELGRKVKQGDTIFVTDRSGVQIGGRFLRLSSEELALLVGAQERVIPRNSIGRIERRDSLWNGMLIGAVPSALVGMAAVGASCSPHCDRDVPVGMLIFGAVGGGIGALVDSGVHGYSIISGPSLDSPNARSEPAPVAFLDELWLRVRQGDTIDVETSRGGKVRGKLVRASRASVILIVGDDHRAIPSSDVRRVTRAGNRYRSGALWGGGILGALGLLSSAACSGHGCGSPLFIAMFMGTTGAAWGAAIGAGISKHPVVYEPGASSGVQVSPILHAGRVGVAVSARF